MKFIFVVFDGVVGDERLMVYLFGIVVMRFSFEFS